MARAESFTVEGAWPSAQLIVPSALALLLAVFDHLKKDIACTSKQKPLAGLFKIRPALDGAKLVSGAHRCGPRQPECLL